MFGRRRSGSLAAASYSSYVPHPRARVWVIQRIITNELWVLATPICAYLQMSYCGSFYALFDGRNLVNADVSKAAAAFGQNAVKLGTTTGST